MPSWGIHFEMAKRINKDNKYDKNDFLMGNILPDIQDGYVVTDISNIVDHLISHYYDGIHNTYDRFCEDNKEILNEDISKGYLVHLLTDQFFNKNFYGRLERLENKMAKVKLLNGETVIETLGEAGIIYKQHDFKIFEKYMVEKYKPEYPKYEEGLVDKCNLIKVIQIKDRDIRNVTNYLKNERHKRKADSNYLFYTQNELEEIFEECEKFINNYLENMENKYF